MASTRFGDKGVAIERLDVSAYTVPSDFPESDGTYSWDKTTIVIVEASAGGKKGAGLYLRRRGDGKAHYRDAGKHSEGAGCYERPRHAG